MWFPRKMVRNQNVQKLNLGYLANRLSQSFPLLKDWLKMWAKTSRIDLGDSRKSLEGISSNPEELYCINHAFDFLGVIGLMKKGIMVVEISKGSSRWGLRSWFCTEKCKLKVSAMSCVFVSLASSISIQFGELVILDRPIISFMVFQSNFTSLRYDNKSFL